MLWFRNEDDFDENVSMELVRSMRHLNLGHEDVGGTALDQTGSMPHD